jgi:ketosteroid isomerase-like protein
MKQRIVVSVAVFLVFLLALILGRANGRSETPEQEVRNFEQRANAAYEANDLPKYFSFYASDFTQYLPEGRTDLAAYKKEWTDYIGEGNRVEKVQLSDMHIQTGPSGDTAVASYILHVARN